MEEKKNWTRRIFKPFLFLKALIRLFDQCSNRVVQRPITQDARHLRHDPSTNNISPAMLKELRSVYCDEGTPMLPLSIYTDLSHILKINGRWLDPLENSQTPNEAPYNNPPIFPSEQFIPAPTGFF